MIGSLYFASSGEGYEIGEDASTGEGPFMTEWEALAPKLRRIEEAAVKELAKKISDEGLELGTDAGRAAAAEYAFQVSVMQAAALVQCPLTPPGDGFPLSHGDFHMFNTAVNDSGAIVGLFDLDHASTVPLPQVTHLSAPLPTWSVFV